MDKEEFRESLATPAKRTKRTEEDIREELQNKYKILTTGEVQGYMQYIFLTIGQEIEKNFPGVQFYLKGRVKSPNSYNEKIERILRKDSKKEKDIFDTIGFCIVIEKIPYGVNIDHKLCRKHLTQRERIRTRIESATIKLEDLKNKYAEENEEYKLEVEEVKEELELLKKLGADETAIKKKEARIAKLENWVQREKDNNNGHISTQEELIEAIQEQYDMKDMECNNDLARHVLNKIIESPEMAKKLGIARVPHRAKVHDGGKSGYYVACHDTIKTSKLKDLGMDVVMEIKAMSEQNYRESIEGKAQDSKCEGKERVLPAFGTTDEEHEKFRKIVMNDMPKSMVYQGEGKNSEARVYVCSEVENFTYHFLEALEDNPELFKKILSKKKLFSDKPIIVKEEKSGSDEIDV